MAEEKSDYSYLIPDSVFFFFLSFLNLSNIFANQIVWTQVVPCPGAEV